MENFFVDEDFYLDLQEYCDYNEVDIDEISMHAPMKVELSELEPAIQFDLDMLMELLDDDRCSEDTYDDILKVLKDNIDLEKINSLVPKLYYPNNKFHTFTREDFMDVLK